jgi:hypothetical protein
MLHAVLMHACVLLHPSTASPSAAADRSAHANYRTDWGVDLGTSEADGIVLYAQSRGACPLALYDSRSNKGLGLPGCIAR